MKGYTLLEILIATAIIAALAVISIGALSKFGTHQSIESDTSAIVSALTRARNLTLQSEGGNQYGVYFESGRAVQFQGSSYNSGDLNNKEVGITGKTSISWSLSGGGSAVVFERLTGRALSNGTVTISGSNGVLKTITIYDTGTIE